MAQLRVTILDPTATRKTQVEMPDDIPASRLIPALTSRMGLPASTVDGRLIAYRLGYSKDGMDKVLVPSETLADTGIRDEDTLRVYAESRPPYSLPSPPIGALAGQEVRKKIFLSWSGQRSRALAQSLYAWIPLVLYYAEPWLSEADIVAGTRWAHRLAEELETSQFGIICVTRENLSSPWLLFETGSLAASLKGSCVIPLLLDIELSDLGGPLAQFQAKKIGKDGLFEVILSVNRMADNHVPEPRARRLFEALWPQLEAQIAAIPGQERSAAPLRPQNEILEELVMGVRSLDTRLQHVETAASNDARHSRPGERRLHLLMIHKLAQLLAEKPEDLSLLQVAASLVRDDMSWLYELTLAACKAVESGPSSEGPKALLRLRQATEFALGGGPIDDAMGSDDTIQIEVEDLPSAATEGPLPDRPRTDET
jgi:hypothetical protein